MLNNKRKLIGLLISVFLNLFGRVNADCTQTYANESLKISGDCTVGYYLISASNTPITASNLDDTCTSENKCTLVYCNDTSGTNGCSSTTLTGYVLFTIGSKLLTCENSSCYPVNSPSGYYINAGAAANTASIINCSTGGTCSTETSPGGYYLNAGDDSSTNPIISCTSGSACTSTNVSESCTIGGLYTGNKFCIGTETDDAKEFPSTATTSSYYLISVSTGTPFATTASSVVVKLGAGAVVLVNQPSGYYINAGAAANTASIINCSTGGTCSTETSPGGYYLNADDDSSAKPIIKCTSGSACTSTNVSESCTIGGLYTGNKFCISTNTDEAKDIPSDTTYYYYKLTISKEQANPFTGEAADSTNDKDILVKVGNGAVVLQKNTNELNELNLYAVKDTNVVSDEATYTACATNNSILKYTFDANSNIVAKTKQCIQKCNLASNNATGCKEGYYLADDSKNYVTATSTSTGTLYKCTTESETIKCNAISTNIPIGYLVNAGNQNESVDIPFIKCELSIDSQNVKSTVCKPYTPVAITTNCSDSTPTLSVGDIVAVTNNEGVITYDVCLALSDVGTIPLGTRNSESTDPNLGITANTDKTGNYMIGGSLVDSSKDSLFVILKVGDANATVNQDEGQTIYQYTDDKALIYNQFTCTTDSNGALSITAPSNPVEYSLDSQSDGVNFYEKTTTP